MGRRKQTNDLAALAALPWTPLVAGSWLVVAGIRKGSILAGVLAAVGGALLYRTISRPAPSQSDRRPLFARGLMIKKSVHVDRSPAECYRFWRNLENLCEFMDHLQSVREVSKSRSRWVAKLVGGASIEWDAEIVKDMPGEIIGWRSLPGSPLQTAGSVRFEPVGKGTQVMVTFKFDPPAGKVGAAVAELLGDAPSKRIGEELHRFKTTMEKRAEEAAFSPERTSDPVDRSSIESFPASDPPSWNPSQAQS